MLDHPISELLGELSWPLYILHVVVWRCYQRFVDETFPPNFFPFLLVLPAVVCRALHLRAPSLFDG